MAIAVIPAITAIAHVVSVTVIMSQEVSLRTRTRMIKILTGENEAAL